MSRARALSCPLCGGVVPPPLDTRTTRCGFCDRPLHYAGEDFIPRLALEPKLSPEGLQEAFFALLRDPHLPKDLKREAIVLQKRRRWVPLYLLSGKRGGILDSVRERVQRQPSSSWMNVPIESADGIGVRERYLTDKPKVISEPDTRVVLGDFHYVYSAASLEGWGLYDTLLQEVARRRLDDVVPASVPDLARSGEILEADLPLERIIEKGAESLMGGGSGVAVLEIAPRILYFPVMEILFRYSGQLFSVTIEEVEGKPLTGRLPFRREWALWGGIPIACCLGLLTGKVARLLLLLEPSRSTRMEDYIAFLVVAAMFLLPVLGFGLQVVWTLIRAPFQVEVAAGGGFRVVRAGDLPESPFGPLNSLVGAAVRAISGERAS